MLVQDDVSLITGAATGIGQATAKRFAEEGAKVVVADVDVEGGKATVDDIADAGGDATFVETDVSRAADVQHAIEVAIETYGGLDVLHNNAGVLGPSEEVARYDESAFDAVIDVNLNGVFHGLKYGIDAMLAGDGGSIINTASVSGERGFTGRCAYSASKAAVDSLTRVAAMEYAGDGIRVNAVLPGFIKTPMSEASNEQEPSNPERLDRYAVAPAMERGVPRDAANAVLYLGSDMSACVTGVSLPVDSGYLAKP